MVVVVVDVNVESDVVVSVVDVVVVDVEDEL